MAKKTPSTTEVFDPQCLTPANLELYRHLVTNESDYLEFVSKYWRFPEKQGMAISMFRYDRIISLNLPYSDLLQYFHIDPIGSLQRQFQQPVSKADCDLVLRKIESGEITLEEIYNNHRDEPSYMLLRCLHSKKRKLK